MGEAASIVLRRRVEWIDTDASGIYHWTTVFRLIEAAEAALHDRLGIRQRTFGRTPRVHVEADFRREVSFYEVVDLDLRVARVGDTSARYDFTLRRDEDVIAEGHLVTVFVSQQPGGTPTPWSDDLRAALLEAGNQGVVEDATEDPRG